MAAETVTIIDYLGSSHVLDGSTTANPLCFSRAGFGMPPVSQLDQRSPGQPGTRIRYSDILPRPVVLGLNVSGNGNESTLRTQLRTMTSTWFSPIQTCTVRNTAADGTQRDLVGCVYLDGMPLDESYPNRRPGSVTVPLSLLAPDPFWYDAAQTLLTWNLQSGGSNPFLSSQFLPILLEGSTVFINVVITNSGDYETWPVWAIHGPLTTPIQLVNNTTGKALKFTANGGLSLTASQTLNIDTYAGTALLQDGSSVASYVSSDSVVWPLAVGANDVTVNGINPATSQGTLVSVRYKQRYWSC